MVSKGGLGVGGLRFLPFVHVCGHTGLGVVHVTDKSTFSDLAKVHMAKCPDCDGMTVWPDSYVRDLRTISESEYEPSTGRNEYARDHPPAFQTKIPDYSWQDIAKQTALCTAFGTTFTGAEPTEEDSGAL